MESKRTNIQNYRRFELPIISCWLNWLQFNCEWECSVWFANVGYIYIWMYIEHLSLVRLVSMLFVIRCEHTKDRMRAQSNGLVCGESAHSCNRYYAFGEPLWPMWFVFIDLSVSVDLSLMFSMFSTFMHLSTSTTTAFNVLASLIENTVKNLFSFCRSCYSLFHSGRFYADPIHGIHTQARRKRDREKEKKTNTQITKPKNVWNNTNIQY